MAGTGSVRPDGEDLRRRQLIEATIESLADVGFAACTLMDIGRRAGVSPGLVAHYFGDKDGLLEATLRYMAGRISRLVSRRLAEAPSPRARVQAVIDANLAPEEFDRRTASVWLAFWGQVLHSTRFRRVQNVYQSRMLSNLRHALRQMVPERDAEHLAETIAAIIDGLWLRETLVAKGEHEGSGARAIATALVDAELAAIRARPAPASDVAMGGDGRVVGQHIGGRVVAGGVRSRFRAINPATGEILAEVEAAGPADLEAAIDAARRGQAIWAAMGGVERGHILRHAADLLRARERAMARLEAADTGQPIRYVREDIAAAADGFDRFAALAAVPRVDEALDLGPGRLGTLRRVPMGIVAVLGTGTRPFHTASLQAAAALAAGNALILKTSDLAPLSTFSLAALMAEAGLPAGVFNVLHGPDELGGRLADHPDLVTVGAGGQGGATLIVFDDADLDAAVAATLELAFRAGASGLIGGCRVLVQQEVKASFLDQLVAETARIVTGDPLDPRTEWGAMISAGHLDRALAVVGKACADGTHLLAGGRRAEVADCAAGAFLAPTILEATSGEAAVLQTGSAGIVMVTGFVDDADVIRMANLAVADKAAFIFTRDAGRGHHVADRLRAATSWVNLRVPLPATFDSASDSWRLERHTRLKSICVDLSPSGSG